MTHYRTQKEIDREFDDKFKGWWHERTTPDHLKHYIHSLRLADLEAVIEMALSKYEADDKLLQSQQENDYIRGKCTAYSNIIYDLRTLLENLKKQV